MRHISVILAIAVLSIADQAGAQFVPQANYNQNQWSGYLRLNCFLAPKNSNMTSPLLGQERGGCVWDAPKYFGGNQTYLRWSNRNMKDPNALNETTQYFRSGQYQTSRFPTGTISGGVDAIGGTVDIKIQPLNTDTNPTQVGFDGLPQATILRNRWFASSYGGAYLSFIDGPGDEPFPVVVPTGGFDTHDVIDQPQNRWYGDEFKAEATIQCLPGPSVIRISGTSWGAKITDQGGLTSENGQSLLTPEGSYNANYINGAMDQWLAEIRNGPRNFGFYDAKADEQLVEWYWNPNTYPEMAEDCDDGYTKPGWEVVNVSWGIPDHPDHVYGPWSLGDIFGIILKRAGVIIFEDITGIDYPVFETCFLEVCTDQDRESGLKEMLEDIIAESGITDYFEFYEPGTTIPDMSTPYLAFQVQDGPTYKRVYAITYNINWSQGIDPNGPAIKVELSNVEHQIVFEAAVPPPDLPPGDGLPCIPVPWNNFCGTGGGFGE